MRARLAVCTLVGLGSCTGPQFEAAGRGITPDEVYLEVGRSEYDARGGPIEGESLVVGTSWAIGPREVVVRRESPVLSMPEPEKGSIVLPAGVVSAILLAILGALKLKAKERSTYCLRSLPP